MQNDFILPTLNDPQKQFVSSVKYNTNTLFVAGWGTGKTVAGFYASYKLAYCWANGFDGAWLAPTYGTLEKSLIKAWIEFMPRNMYRTILSKSAPRIELYGVRDREGRPLSKPTNIYLLSADSEISLESLNLAWIGADEIQGISKETWDAASGRMRIKGASVRRFGLGLPESETWLQDVLETNPPKDEQGKPVYYWVKGKPADNQANLNDDYIKNLLATLPADMIKSRVEGAFSRGEGYVYREFSRLKNVGNFNYLPGVQLAFCMDFNNEPMTAIIGQYIKSINTLIFIDEIIKDCNVDDMCKLMIAWCEEKKIDYKDKESVIVIPDANSGRSIQQGYGDTNIRIIRGNSFTVRHFRFNPSVIDTDNEVKLALATRPNGLPGLLFASRCTKSIEAMGRLKYKGRKNPNNPYSHPTDAIRYGVHYYMPVDFEKKRKEYKPNKNTVSVNNLTGGF